MKSPFAPGIRDSSSVTWSLSFGPASGSFGGFPPIFLLFAFLPALQLLFVLRSLYRMPLLRALFDLLLRVPDRCQPWRCTLPGCPACSASASWSACCASFRRLHLSCQLLLHCSHTPKSSSHPAHPPQPHCAQLRRHLQTCLNSPSTRPETASKFGVMVRTRLRLCTETPPSHTSLAPACGSKTLPWHREQQRHHDRMIRSPAATTAVPARHSDRVALLFPLQSAICWSGSHSCMDGGRSIGVSRSSARRLP